MRMDAMNEKKGGDLEEAIPLDFLDAPLDEEKEKESEQHPSPASEKDKQQDATTEDDDNWAHSPTNPLNWPLVRRLPITILLSFGSLVTLMSASMTAPALSTIGTDLRFSAATTQLSMSIYILALAFGPLLIAPLSELYGRKWVYLGAHAWYVLWNALCGLRRERGLLVAGRFLAGLGSSVGLALLGPMMVDMWRVEVRGTAVAISGLVPYLGPALGPILGGVITQETSWTWIFWVLSIFDGALILVGVLVVKESYGPILRQRQRRRHLAKEVAATATTPAKTPLSAIASKIASSLARPLKLLFTRPIIVLLSLTMAYTFGVYTLALSTFGTMWQDHYGLSITDSGLHYIAIALGYSLATQLGGPSADRLRKHLIAKSPTGASVPEHRVPLLLPPILLTPGGLLLYGWAVEKHLHWAAVDVGVMLFACGNGLGGQILLLYLYDEFTVLSASAGAAARLLSNVAGFAFPIFAPALYDGLGYGWGNSVLALLYLCVGVPVPIILWKWGERIRKVGRRVEE